MRPESKELPNAVTVYVKYWDALSVTSDGSKAGSSYNSVPSQANYAHPLLLAQLGTRG
jgi:hypothetical protein